MNQDIKNAVQKYESLIKKFLNKEISVKEFETAYLQAFKNEDVFLGDELFLPLDWLFAEVDAYTDQPFSQENNKFHWINEDQLRASAQKTLDQLKELGWE